MCKALTYVLLLVLPFSGMGRPLGFSSGRLAAIAAALGLALPENPSGRYDVFPVSCQGRTLPVVVEYDAGTVTHIGLDIFGDSFKVENRLVCDFVERYLLESLLENRPVPGEYDSPFGKVVTMGDLFSVLETGKDARTFSISMDGDGAGCVVLTPDSGLPPFSVIFPTDIRLLTGEKKDELEKGFLQALTAGGKVVKREIPGNLKRVERELYVSENGFYEIEASQNSAFFRRKGLSFQPLCESSRPVESVMTLLTGHIRKKDYSVRATFHQYGFVRTELSVSLERLIGRCLDEGCVPYVGIESNDGESVVATLFMVNAPLGYAHTFHFTVNTALLDSTAGVLQARAYLYTPLNHRKS